VLFHLALLAHRAARSIDPHRSIRCTPLRAITQSPRPSRCHLSMSCCSGEQTVESPSRRRRRPLARNTRTIYRAKCFKCGWDCLFLNKSAPYASIYPLLYTLIALPSSQPRSKRELDFKFVSGRPMKHLEVGFEPYAQCNRTTVRWSRNHRCRRHHLLLNFVLLSAFRHHPLISPTLSLSHAHERILL
jgi:hypothetical protein